MTNFRLSSILHLNKELLFTVISYISIFFSGIITIKVFTHVFTPAEYGNVILTTSISSLVITTFVSPLMQGASRYFDSANPELSFRYIKKYLRIFQCIVFFVFISIGIFYIITHRYENFFIVILLLLTLFSDSMGQYYNSLLHINRKRVEYTISTSIFNWFKLILTIPFILFSKSIPGIIAVLISWIIASLISNIYSSKCVDKISITTTITNKNINIQNNKKLDSFIISFFLLNIFLWLQSWADKWILSYVFSNSNELGIYISYSQVAMIPFLALNGLIIMYFGPIIFGEISNSKNPESLKKVKDYVLKLKFVYVGLSFLSLAFIFLFNKFIITILINSNHSLNSKLFILTAIGSFLFNYSQIQSFSIQCTGLLRYIIIPNILSGLLLILCNLFLAELFGVQGAVIILNIILVFKIIITYYFEESSWKNFIWSFSNSNI